MKVSLPLAGLLLLTGAAAARAQSGRPSAYPPARPESTLYRETSRYDDVVAFLGAVTRGQRRMRLTHLGYSSEGRRLPLVVVGNVADATPDALRRSGLLRVYVQGNIHGGEVEGKEAALLVLRGLAAGRYGPWLDSLVLLVAPIYNADGNERVALTNRPLQNGPAGGTGQRANAQGLDLNRDHMKLESPEARSFVGLLNAYDPHVTIDLHTTDGSVHGYLLTYETALHPGTDPALVRFARETLFPAVTRQVRARDGWDLFYYGNLPSGPEGRRDAPERGWYTFDHRPRFNNNYVGLRNRLALLSEAYAYASFEDRIRATVRFLEAALDVVHARAGEIRRLTAEADARLAPGTTLPLRARLRRGPDSVEILIGQVAETRHPLTGQRVLQRLDVRRPERMADYTTFEGVEPERWPAAYIVPAGLSAVVDRLEAHGIRTSRLTTAVTVPVERFRVDSASQAERPFQNHRERTAFGAWEAVTRELPAGSVVIATAQPLGRLAFYLLEPRSDDGLLTWNFFDDQLARMPGEYPVVRTFTPL